MWKTKLKKKEKKIPLRYCNHLVELLWRDSWIPMVWPLIPLLLLWLCLLGTKKSPRDVLAWSVFCSLFFFSCPFEGESREFFFVEKEWSVFCLLLWEREPQWRVRVELVFFFLCLSDFSLACVCLERVNWGSHFSVFLSPQNRRSFCLSPENKEGTKGSLPNGFSCFFFK